MINRTRNLKDSRTELTKIFNSLFGEPSHLGKLAN